MWGIFSPGGMDSGNGPDHPGDQAQALVLPELIAFLKEKPHPQANA